MATPDILPDFINFLNESCTNFHAVEAGKKRLLSAGFIQISEADAWNLELGKKYFFTRNGTSLIAFFVGENFKPGNGFTVIGAHTDSPCLKIKPVSVGKKGESLVLNTQPYGGGLWHTWFDRDLGIAGRVLTKKPCSREKEGEKENSFPLISSSLVRIDSPIARIPTLAIHLTDASERDKFSPNLQEHCKALLTMDPSAISLKSEVVKVAVKEGEKEVVKEKAEDKRFNPFLIQLIKQSLGESLSEGEEIVDLELQLFDIQPSCTGGACNDFVLSGRLDNLCSSFQSLRALVDSSDSCINKQGNVCMALLFDHEEIGSSSAVGAGSSLFMDTLKTITQNLTDGTHSTLMRSLRKSFVVSADMAHGLHPNYQSKHDPEHAPKLNGGLVIKHNANQRYATNAVSATLLRTLAEKAGETVQEFAVRSDAGCGSTIGPIIATLSGINTVDVGSPQFSMHSIREMMGSKDVQSGYNVFRSVYENHHEASKGINIE